MGSETMKRILLWTIALCLAMAGAASAQPFPANEVGVTMGHLHLNSRDVEANKKIFVAMGGTSVKLGDFDVVRFPGVLVYLHGRAGSPPPTGNSGRTDQAFVVTADELRVEILEDKAQTMPIQHHHIHYFVPEAAIPQIQAWYAKWFGAKPGMRGQNVSDDIPGANLSFSKADQLMAGTKGRVLDHIGFDVKNLEAFTKQLEASGIKLDRPFFKVPGINLTLAFITDPWGTYIELNEWTE
jgi:catechol 2,3-dioxygenase-like lactoylglutathione lyase family enzyme